MLGRTLLGRGKCSVGQSFGHPLVQRIGGRGGLRIVRLEIEFGASVVQERELVKAGETSGGIVQGRLAGGI